MTFDPHPSMVLSKVKKTVKYLTPLAQKGDEMAKLGVDKKSIDGRLWREETNAYFRENKPVQAMKILEGLLDAKSTKESYKFLSNWVKTKTSDKAALAKAAAWAVKGK